MKRRLLGVLTIAAAVSAIPTLAVAQEQEVGEPNLNWVFGLALVILVGFVVFLGFALVYYLLAVVARNRRYASPAAAQTAQPVRAAVPAAAPAAQAPPAQAPPAPAPAARAEPAPAPAPTTEAPAPAPRAEAPAAAPAAPSGLPKIDPMNLPDGIDAVTRGRLKKLAVLQERGQAPPSDLLDELKPVLEQIAGAPIDTSAAPAAQAPAAPAAPAPQAPAVAAEPAPAADAAPQAEAAPAEAAPAADTGDIPRIDPMNLPDGIDAVTRGRLKKLAVFQERGQAPPADLIESLQAVLDQIKGS